MRRNEAKRITIPAYLQADAWPSAREWWAALRYVFFTFTVIVALAMIGSFFSYERVLAEGHPWLPRATCPGCIFCGMTRSFCALSAGHWQEAFAWNRGGPFLYAGGWIWLAGAGWLLARAVRQRLGRNLAETARAR